MKTLGKPNTAFTKIHLSQVKPSKICPCPVVKDFTINLVLLQQKSKMLLKDPATDPIVEAVLHFTHNAGTSGRRDLLP